MIYYKGKKMKYRSKKGFTLVELLVVVLILGALAAIAIPRISSSTVTAKRNACFTNIDIINSQTEMYYANEGVWPTDAAALFADVNSFPEGAFTCPVDGSSYTLNANHRITGHSH